MKKTAFKTLILSFLLFLLTSGLQSQTFSGNNEASSENRNINVTNPNPQLLANLGISTAENPRNATITGNTIFLRQVGDFNQAAISTNTNSSEIKLLQNGNSNFTGLDYTANTAISNLIQNGDNNRILDYVNNPSANISLDLVQDGSYMNFERDGSNNLTKSLKFRQSEATPNIIIRSIN